MSYGNFDVHNAGSGDREGDLVAVAFKCVENLFLNDIGLIESVVSRCFSCYNRALNSFDVAAQKICLDLVGIACRKVSERDVFLKTSAKNNTRPL